MMTEFDMPPAQLISALSTARRMIGADSVKQRAINEGNKAPPEQYANIIKITSAPPIWRADMENGEVGKVERERREGEELTICLFGKDKQRARARMCCHHRSACVHSETKLNLLCFTDQAT